MGCLWFGFVLGGASFLFGVVLEGWLNLNGVSEGEFVI